MMKFRGRSAARRRWPSWLKIVCPLCEAGYPRPHTPQMWREFEEKKETENER